MNESTPKQQIVDKIKSSTSALVTVSNSPSVDALSAALGLTLILNKLKKHTVAIVSGTIPPAIMFLEPTKTFESSVDSLRDFIIALDKEKADKLRYGVEGDVVKIYITPYKTTISEADLNFSQGDYNVDLVFALGVDQQEHLDTSLIAHGRILHDASVVTIQNTAPSHISGIDWTESKISSLCEMIADLADALTKDKPILDKQIATALLTGIVAETERFSNLKTTSQAMTIAAKLMAAGADQQLVAARLQDGHALGKTSKLPNDGMQSPTSIPIKQQIQSGTLKTDGGLIISHASTATLEEISDQVKAQSQYAATTYAEQQLSKQLESLNTAKTGNLSSGLASELESFSQPKSDIVLDKPFVESDNNKPVMGNSLRPTTEQPFGDSTASLNGGDNKVLSSEYSTPENSPSPLINSSQATESSESHADIFAGSYGQMQSYPNIKGDVNASLSNPQSSQQEIAQPSQPSHAEALAEVHAVFSNSNLETNQSPVSPTSNLPPQTQFPGSIVGQNPGLTMPPPLPDFTSMPPPPPNPFNQNQSNQPSNQSPPNDPSQFRIPGQ